MQDFIFIHTWYSKTLFHIRSLYLYTSI